MWGCVSLTSAGSGASASATEEARRQDVPGPLRGIRAIHLRGGRSVTFHPAKATAAGPYGRGDLAAGTAVLLQGQASMWLPAGGGAAAQEGIHREHQEDPPALASGEPAGESPKAQEGAWRRDDPRS